MLSQIHFNPHSLAESDVRIVRPYLREMISIHALLAESDMFRLFWRVDDPISIHALLAESDLNRSRAPAVGAYFNPRSPCGERLRCIGVHNDKQDFNPRSPCGERL